MIQVNIRFDEKMVTAIDEAIDSSIGENRSLFIRESVKERLKSLKVKKND